MQIKVDARASYTIGQRVKMTQAGLAQGLQGKKPRKRCFGTVVGYGRECYQIRVIKDGTKTPSTYDMGFWEPE